MRFTAENAANGIRIYSNYFELENKSNYLDDTVTHVILGGIRRDRVAEDVQEIKTISQTHHVIYIMSTVDHQLAEELGRDNRTYKMAAELTMFWSLAHFKFKNNTQLICVFGGIDPLVSTYERLYSEINVCATDLINEKTWHQYYDGRFGFVVSNNSLNDKPGWYPASLSIGVTGKSTVINFDFDGVKDVCVSSHVQ